MLQEVFFRQDGAAQTVKVPLKGPLHLDSLASHLGVAAGRLQLQDSAAAFVAIMPGEVWTLEELRSQCRQIAGTTATSPIVFRSTHLAGEREPCSAELSPNRAVLQGQAEVPKSQQ